MNTYLYDVRVSYVAKARQKNKNVGRKHTRNHSEEWDVGPWNARIWIRCLMCLANLSCMALTGNIWHWTMANCRSEYICPLTKSVSHCLCLSAQKTKKNLHYQACLIMAQHVNFLRMCMLCTLLKFRVISKAIFGPLSWSSYSMIGAPMPPFFGE